MLSTFAIFASDPLRKKNKTAVFQAALVTARSCL